MDRSLKYIAPIYREFLDRAMFQLLNEARKVKIEQQIRRQYQV
jgi:hypothetical protein